MPAAVVQSSNDSEDYDVEENGDSETADESDDVKKGGFPFTEEAKLIPHRMEQVLINWVFIWASVALLLDFGALQDLVRTTGKMDGFAELCNWFGVVSCILWLLGFILLAHWLHSVGATQMGLMGCYSKLIASIFFNLQPMTGTMNDPMLGGPAGLWWSNLTGILFFHIGNIISCTDFFLHTPPGADKKKGWGYHGNLPITAMWTYQAATWFLVASNFMACSWNGTGPSFVKIGDPPVFVCQMAGGFLLLFGSIIFTVWCDGFRNFSH